jgi:hypothetical protein
MHWMSDLDLQADEARARRHFREVPFSDIGPAIPSGYFNLGRDVSGSRFFDDSSVPPSAREKLHRECRQRVRRR